jgi:transcription antitermination factor NusG
MDVAGECWYCVACRSKAEESVAQQLARKADVGVLLAKMRIKVGKGSESRAALVPMFPGYLFVRMRLASSLIAVRYTPGVRDLVRFGSRIPVVPDEVIRELTELTSKPCRCTSKPRLKEGMTASIEDGPFEGFTGRVLKMNSAADRVQLLIELLGESRVLEVSRTDVRV